MANLNYFEWVGGAGVNRRSNPASGRVAVFRSRLLPNTAKRIRTDTSRTLFIAPTYIRYRVAAEFWPEKIMI